VSQRDAQGDCDKQLDRDSRNTASSDGPLFLAFVAVHLAAGVVAVITRIVAMLSRKRPGHHPQAGTVYYWALAVVFATMTIPAASRFAADYDLFVLGALSFAAATIGRMARRRRWLSWPRIHMTRMGASYILLVTAFYVDNGPNLPLWRLLPPVAFLDFADANWCADLTQCSPETSARPPLGGSPHRGSVVAVPAVLHFA